MSGRFPPLRAAADRVRVEFTPLYGIGVLLLVVAAWNYATGSFGGATAAAAGAAISFAFEHLVFGRA